MLFLSYLTSELCWPLQLSLYFDKNLACVILNTISLILYVKFHLLQRFFDHNLLPCLNKNIVFLVLKSWPSLPLSSWQIWQKGWDLGFLSLKMCKTTIDLDLLVSASLTVFQHLGKVFSSIFQTYTLWM